VISQDHISAATPLGANLVADGATFRAWAPHAAEAHLELNTAEANFRPGADTLLTKDASSGIWSGFVRGVRDGDAYLFFVVGPDGRAKGFKRDPYARELGTDPQWPSCDCIVRDPDSYPWHDQDFRRPEFSDLVIYQFHVGTFYATNPDGSDRRTTRGGTVLDALFRLDHWLGLGINAVEPLPIVEFETMTSEGYNTGDLFSPEMRYGVPAAELGRYLDRVNELLARRAKSPITLDQLRSHSNQLKAFIDVCHAHGIAVLLDVVYNHAGGGFPGGREGFDPRSLYFFDFQDAVSDNNSLYFTDASCPPGGRFFRFREPQVQQLLIDNARMFLDEYHVDGFRFDEASFIDEQGGFPFLQRMTGELRSTHPDRILIAEYWRHDESFALGRPDGLGAGFHAVWTDGLRNAIRGAVARAAHAFSGDLDLADVFSNLFPPFAPPDAWRAVNCVENHDITYADHSEGGRIAHLADDTDARSRFASGRSRVAAGLLLTGPGIVLLFMGQEILEYRSWHDTPGFHPNTLINWDDLGKVKPLGDHLRFYQDLLTLRKRLKSLRNGSARPYHAPRGNRVVAFHRWVEFEGHDVIIIASLNESTYRDYVIGFPRPGRWLEVFNSVIYQDFFRPPYDGNPAGISADGPPFESMPHSASIVIPAMSFVVFVPEGTM